MKDKDVIIQLNSGNRRKVDDALKYLLRKSRQGSLLPYIRRKVPKHIDPNEILHETIVIFYKNVSVGKFRQEGRNSIMAYLFGVAKNLVLKGVNDKHKKTKEIDPTVDKEDPTINQKIDADYNKELLNNKMALLTPKCRQMLRLYYYKGMIHKDIAFNVGFASEQVSKNALSRCMAKLRSFFKDKDDLL